jgi:hypothetical protein
MVGSILYQLTPKNVFFSRKDAKAQFIKNPKFFVRTF